MRKRILLVGLILGVIGLTLGGCMHVASLVITPTSVIMKGGETATFNAADSLGNPVSVTWSVSSGPGTITAAGVYTAPASVTAVTNTTITAIQVGYAGITSSATVTIEPPAEADLIDAVGDASAWIGTAYDVKSITTSLTSTALTVNIEFTAAPALPPTSGVVATQTQLAGFVCFDIDESTVTGWPSPSWYWLGTYTPSANSAIGVDYYVDLFSRDSSGNYSVYNAVLPATATFAGTTSSVSVTGNVLILVIPLTILGGDDGVTGMNALLGNGLAPSDWVPDSVGAMVTGKSIMPQAVSVVNPYGDFLFTTHEISSWGTAIEVTKTAYPTSVQSGGTVAFTINVKNIGATSVTLTALADDIPSGETVQTTSCVLPTPLPVINVGDSYTCTYNAIVTGNVGEEKTDTVTATATDVYGAEVTASDTATVTIITP